MSCENKHQKRLIRMLSKYGDVKSQHIQPQNNDDINKQNDQSSLGSDISKTRRPSDESGPYGVDTVDAADSFVEPPLKEKQVCFQNTSPKYAIESTLSSACTYQLPTNNTAFKEDVDSTYFHLDFFSGDQRSARVIDINENEKQSKPFVFINSFRQNEVPLIPTNFYHRKDDGFLLRWTGFKFLKNLIDSKDSRHRPIFTYWLMLLEIVILLLILFIYGTGYFGFSQKKISDIVWHQSNSYQPATYSEPTNMWIGPSPSILIREGAIFNPCMKKEKHIFESIQQVTKDERESGCCLRIDHSGCVQTIKSKCSRRTSVWIKSKTNSGPVCGQDPKYCLDNNKNWPDDITTWPICNRNNRTLIMSGNDNYMKCKVQARPCCIGIYGKCTLASQEYCEFVKGHYHSKATLCSQVNCLNDVCGLIPFEKEPNQMYRLILSLFLHAGLIQIAISLFIQYRFMAVFEETYGTRKIIALYLISGIGGNLASALFLPLSPEIGPIGAFFGILSLLLYEIISNWSKLDNPLKTFLKVSYCLPLLFVLGLFVPWINNFSNTFGFVFGLLTVFLILPNNYKHKSFYISLVLLIALTSILLFFFFNNHYVEPFLPYFSYLNCIPIWSDSWCSSMDIKILKEINALN